MCFSPHVLHSNNVVEIHRSGNAEEFPFKLQLLKNIFKVLSLFLVCPAPHSDVYYTNTTSMPEMRNVLVLTMPDTRTYTIKPDLTGNDTVRTQTW